MADGLDVLLWYLYYKYRKPFRSRDKLEHWQKRRLHRQMRYVSSHIPFYHKRGKWGTCPVIDKGVWMAHFQEMNGVGIGREEAEDFALSAERSRDFVPRLRGITVGLSSGTSGRRGIFLISNQEKNRWAGYILAKFLPGSIFKRYTIAFFMRADSNLYQAVSSGRICFHFFDLYGDMEEHLKRLCKMQPDILAGQPSLLLLLARERMEGRLDICPRLVISIAEVLEKEDERQLQSAFGLSVIHQVYQCTEGCLATTCSEGTLHLNEDIVLIEREYLDGQRFVPVVTDLVRRTQPVIRYRLNDILVERRRPCTCKSPCIALEKIEGREDDIFFFSGREGGMKRVFPDFIRRCILFAGSGERNGEYRVVQETDCSITVYADLEEQEKGRVLQEFTRLSDDGGFVLPAIAFRPYFCEPGRKMKRVERKGICGEDTLP